MSTVFHRYRYNIEYTDCLFGAFSISYPILYTILMPIYNFLFLCRSQKPTPAVDWLQCRSQNGLWRSTWLHGPRYSCRTVPYCWSWTTSSLLDSWVVWQIGWHQSRRPQPGSGEPSHSSERTDSTWDVLQEAIQVNQRHNLHIRQHPNIVLHSNQYMISYTDIVHNIGIIITHIAYNIEYDIVYDVWCFNLSRADFCLHETEILQTSSLEESTFWKVMLIGNLSQPQQSWI